MLFFLHFFPRKCGKNAAERERMATVTRTSVIDDIDGSDNAKTIRYSIGRSHYEIDLGPENTEKLYEALAPFIKKSRKATSGRETSRIDQTKVREWAKEQGIEISDRGRLPKGLEKQYREAHA